MKIQLLTAVAILALGVTSAYAGGGRHHGGGGGTDLSNKSKNALAIGKSSSGGSSSGLLGSSSSYLNVSAGRAIAGSIVLEGGACACDFDDVKNRSKNAIAVGNATAGSIHINTMGY
ncbi:hypothetical protein GCM10009133_04420 [Cocleimonas flava]|jgi:hypothetical protein|uniref:Pectate lyase n=1 Tax=Cocleimonas flava TaxID=634765 RepID=A0A4R1F2P9_9GAMM|nr:hypothetical protein [Cocleimonas flava]TCJ86812.1 hypothetical protein EV695_1310 [Cocleimonas flava]